MYKSHNEGRWVKWQIQVDGAAWAEDGTAIPGGTRWLAEGVVWLAGASYAAKAVNL
jgi:hypothetical protein